MKHNTNSVFDSPEDHCRLNNFVAGKTKIFGKTALRYVAILKDEIAKSNSCAPIASEKKALCHYYLGEIYARCAPAITADKKRRQQDNTAIKMLPLKTALMHYLNAMIEVSNIFNGGLDASQYKKIKNKGESILKNVILALNSIASTNPDFSTALDELYPKAKFALQNHLILAKKIFLSRFHPDKDIQQLIIENEKSIFELSNISLAKERVSAKRTQALRKFLSKILKCFR